MTEKKLIDAIVSSSRFVTIFQNITVINTNSNGIIMEAEIFFGLDNKQVGLINSNKCIGYVRNYIVSKIKNNEKQEISKTYNLQKSTRSYIKELNKLYSNNSDEITESK